MTFEINGFCIAENEELSHQMPQEIENAIQDALYDKFNISSEICVSTYPIERNVEKIEPTKELNCHVEIGDKGLCFSYSGEADTIFQKGANAAANQLWDKLSLIFIERKWNKKYGVKNVYEFFEKYSPKDIFEGVIK